MFINETEEHRLKRAKLTASWLINDFSSKCSDAGAEWNESPLPTGSIYQFVTYLVYDVIDNSKAKMLFNAMWENPTEEVHDFVDKLGLLEDHDKEIEAFIIQLVKDNPEKYAETLIKPQAINWFVGQVMKAYKGKATAQNVIAIIESLR